MTVRGRAAVVQRIVVERVLVVGHSGLRHSREMLALFEFAAYAEDGRMRGIGPIQRAVQRTVSCISTAATGPLHYSLVVSVWFLSEMKDFKTLSPRLSR